MNHDTTLARILDASNLPNAVGYPAIEHGEPS